MGLLRSNPSFRYFWSARAVSFVGDGMALIALLLYVQETRESGVAVSLLLLAATIPRLLGPLAGALADRVEQRRLMVACDLGQAALYAAIAALLPPFPVLLALVLVASTLATLFRPAGQSALPALVKTDDLLAANAWLGTALNFQVAVGPLAGGVTTDLLGIRSALGVNALTFVLSAALLTRLPALQPQREETHSFLATAAAGISFARSHPVARAVLLALFTGVAFAAVDNVALVFLARDTLGASPLGFGVLATAFGVGMVLASLVLTGRSVRLSAATLFLTGIVLNGVGTLITGLVPALAAAVFVQMLAGAGNGINNIGADTLMQQSVPRPMLGRVFGLAGTAAFAGGGIAAVAGGVLLDLSSPRTVFVVGGSGVLATAALAWTLLRRAGD